MYACYAYIPETAQQGSKLVLSLHLYRIITLCVSFEEGIQLFVCLTKLLDHTLLAFTGSLGR